ncbi:hypothetical protein D7B12_18235 [Salmonella enterica]|nr:hypothetical protein [Salmonella enterica]
MKPMLKAVFFETIKDLLARGFEVELQASPLTCWGNIRWVDAEGKTQVRALYSSHDCLSSTARVSRQRFIAWFAEAKEQFHMEAAKTLEIGDRVMMRYTAGVVTEIRIRTLREPDGTPKGQERTGVIVVDNKYKLMAGEVRKPDYCDEDDFKALIEYMSHCEGYRHLLVIVPGAVRLRWATKGHFARTKHLNLCTSSDQKLVEGFFRTMSRWFKEIMRTLEEDAHAQVEHDQAVERSVERWFEERGYGY